MATRRRGGGDLSDLKSRLGIQEVQESDAAEADAVPAPTAEEGQPAQGFGGQAANDAAFTPASAGDDGQAGGYEEAAAYTESYPQEDYSQAVSSAETQSEVRLEASPADDFQAAAPSSMALKVFGPILLIVGLLLGIFYGTASTGNKAWNAQIDEATAFIERVQPINQTLTSLKNELEALTVNTYSEQFETLLATAFDPNRLPVLDARSLTGVSTLLSLNGDVGPQLISLATNTQLLNDLVVRHQASTRREMDEIRRELDGNTDAANYAILYDSTEQGRRYAAFESAPTENPYQPIGAFKVTYTTLEVITEGQGNATRYLYEVTFPNGQTRRVPVYEVLPIARDQLIDRTSHETAISRYLGRVTAIRENIDAVSRQAAAAASALETLSQEKKRFSGLF